MNKQKLKALLPLFLILSIFSVSVIGILRFYITKDTDVTISVVGNVFGLELYDLVEVANNGGAYCIAGGGTADLTPIATVDWGTVEVPEHDPQPIAINTSRYYLYRTIADGLPTSEHYATHIHCYIENNLSSSESITLYYFTGTQFEVAPGGYILFADNGASDIRFEVMFGLSGITESTTLTGVNITISGEDAVRP